MNNLILLGIISLLLCYYLFKGIIKEGSTSIGFLKKINSNLFDNIYKPKVKDVPIALRMKVGTREQIDSGNYTEDMAGTVEAFKSGAELINEDNGLKSQMKINTDLNNKKWLRDEKTNKEREILNIMQLILF